MNNPTFRTQFDKIVGAYLRDELRPRVCKACFVGNLLNGSADWIQRLSCEKLQKIYSFDEIMKLESIFMARGESDSLATSDRPPDYEDRLYRAMERALLYLRQLHESKGEVIEGYEFRKRELAKIKT